MPSTFKSFTNSGVIETIELNEIFRQAAQSQIVTNAHKVNMGESFLGLPKEELEGKLQDFFYINETGTAKMLEDVVSLCTGRLKKFGNYDFFKDIQVLTPTKKGKLGTKELNIELQMALNENREIEKKHGERVFRVGDRVMQIKNNYDIY